MELINMKVWEEIDKELGEITNVELEHHEGYSTLKYKSNGIIKHIYATDKNMKILVQSFMYCMKEFSNPLN
jgi:hypothetical protein